MDVVTGVRQKVSTYAQRTAASIDQKLTEQEPPGWKGPWLGLSLAQSSEHQPPGLAGGRPPSVQPLVGGLSSLSTGGRLVQVGGLSSLSCSSPAARPPVSAACGGDDGAHHALTLPSGHRGLDRSRRGRTWCTVAICGDHLWRIYCGPASPLTLGRRGMTST